MRHTDDLSFVYEVTVMLLCVRIPDFALAIALDGHPGSAVPLLLADRYDRGHVIALDARARQEGARPGQTVTQAVAMVPNARVVVYDQPRTTRLWSEILDALDAVTPLIEDAREGIAFFDMRGIEGDVAAWRASVCAIVGRFGLEAIVGSASNRFCAYAATWINGATIAEGDEARTVAALPLDLLELDLQAVSRLQVLGIRTLGELARLPHGPFVRRFGRQAARWHDWARGVDRTPFLPRGHALAIEAAMFGEGSAESEEAVLFALRV